MYFIPFSDPTRAALLRSAPHYCAPFRVSGPFRVSVFSRSYYRSRWDCEELDLSRGWNWRVVGPEYPTLEMWRVVGPRVDCGRSAAGWGV